MSRFIIGISGASGVVLSVLLIKELINLGCYTDIVVSSSGFRTIYYELGKEFADPQKFKNLFSDQEKKSITFHSINDIGAPIASGSYATEGMVIVPCSMATIAALSAGFSDNALRRAADVTMKEKRRLVLVPREAPLSSMHLENLLKLSRIEGVFIFPPCPQWYFKPKSLEEVEKLLVGKIISCLGLRTNFFKEWTDEG